MTAELVCLLFFNLVKVDFQSHLRHERQLKWKRESSSLLFGCDYVLFFLMGWRGAKKKINKKD